MKKVRALRSAPLITVVMMAAALATIVPAGATRSASSFGALGHDLTGHSSAAGRNYAVALLSKIPVPSGATPLASPIQPINPVTGNLGYARSVDIARYYLLPAWFGISAFSESRFPHSQWEGSGSTRDGGYHTSDSFSIMPFCPDRHSTYCGVTYTGQELSGHGMELRVDVAVVWMPIHVAHLPNTGVVTVTGYSKTSAMQLSSGQVHVTLSTSQVKELRDAIALLRNSPGGMCMEDSALYKISVTSANRTSVIWSASADLCPGVLTVTGQGSRFIVNDRSCPLDQLVATFFPAHEALGTKAGLKTCGPSW